MGLRCSLWGASLSLLLFMLAEQALAAEPPAFDYLLSLSLEQLQQVEVTTPSKHGERFLDTPWAVHVISRDDIRRSGATTIAEALRLAPGVHIAQREVDRWALGIRGFSAAVSTRILVLIDGRRVQTAIQAVTFLDKIDLPIDIVERIEVIRGPGGPVWGANGLNGIVNIITRKTGGEEPGALRVRFGSEQRLGVSGV